MPFTITRRKFILRASLGGAALGLGSFCWPNSGHKVRFGLVTDSHYADREPQNTRFYRQSLDKMREFLQVMQNEQVDFIMHLGDFKDEDTRQQETDTLKYLRDLEAIFSSFNGAKYHCIGNHDVDSITKLQFLENVTNTGIPNTSSYYSFDHQGFHFVVLDANYHRDGRDQFYKEGADWQDPNIPAGQLQWLREDLEKTAFPSVLCCHHPLYEYNRDGFKLHVNQFAEVQQILEASGKVLSVFQGHVHEEGYRRINGILYCTQWGMVDYSGLENNSFSIVEIDNKALNLIGYKRVASNQFAF